MSEDKQTAEVAAENLRVAEAVTPGATDDIAAAVAAMEAEANPEPVKDEPVKEEPVKAAPEPPADEEPKGPQWAALMKAEKRNQELRDRLNQLERDAKSAREDAESLRSAFAQDPIKALESLGLTYEDLTDRILGDGKPGDAEVARRAAEEQRKREDEYKRELAELRSRIDSKEQAEQLNRYRAEISDVLASEEFELLQSYPGAADEVLQLAAIHAQETQQVLPAKEAAAMIQEQLRTHLQSLGSHKAVRRLLGLETDEAQPSQKSGTKSQRSPTTLTNNIAATPSETIPDEGMTEWERIQAAARLIGPEAWS